MLLRGRDNSARHSVKGGKAPAPYGRGRAGGNGSALESAPDQRHASAVAQAAGPFRIATWQPVRSIRRLVGSPTTCPECCRTCRTVAARIGIVGERPDAVLLQPGPRLVGVARIDVDRDDLESRPAEIRLELVEARHLLSAWHAPGRPEVHQHRPAVEARQGDGSVSVGTLEGDIAAEPPAPRLPRRPPPLPWRAAPGARRPASTRGIPAPIARRDPNPHTPTSAAAPRTATAAAPTGARRLETERPSGSEV